MSTGESSWKTVVATWADKIYIPNPLLLKVGLVTGGQQGWSGRETQSRWCGLLVFRAVAVLSPSARLHRKTPPFLSFGFADSAWFAPVISKNDWFLSFLDGTVFNHGQNCYRWGFAVVVSGWPSGLRRQTQACVFPFVGLLVSVWRRGFESHFWQDSLLFSAGTFTFQPFKNLNLALPPWFPRHLSVILAYSVVRPFLLLKTPRHQHLSNLQSSLWQMKIPN